MPCNGRGRSSTWTHEGMERELLGKPDSTQNLLTQKLCYLCGEAVRLCVFNQMTEGNPDLRAWWADHRATDAARLGTQMENYWEGCTTAEEVAMIAITKAKKRHPVSTYQREWMLDLARTVGERRHQKQAKRVDEVKFRKAALAKLTASERLALGLEE